MRQIDFSKATEANKYNSPNSQSPYEDKKVVKLAQPLEDLVVIHVYDQGRGLMKDFHCQKHIMLTKMRYFDNYIKGAKSINDLDISVHCDVFVFEWLM